MYVCCSFVDGFGDSGEGQPHRLYCGDVAGFGGCDCWRSLKAPIPWAIRFDGGYWIVLPLEGKRLTALRMNSLRFASHLMRKSPPTRVNLRARVAAISNANCFTCLRLISLTFTPALIL